jgi:hypothetical protein
VLYKIKISTKTKTAKMKSNTLETSKKKGIKKPTTKRSAIPPRK